ncbi:lipase [Peribacillus glennii]|uniref:triacylglycerol lipase n=1 Tax=Peribacillus glennii TaxID=2303991 RepID=A0A372LB64_9BACI|nr:lipase [Peribacillus glennii]
MGIVLCLVFSQTILAFAKEAEPAKKNRYPIVLVHGLTGWGEDEMSGFRYWGGQRDLNDFLNSKGYKVYTAAVGPVSSNWDRAAELYAFIKGGTVDYGAAHAKKHGHARFGRTYKGLYPGWNGKSKIHLLGHSMGGQTSRMLTELLRSGSAEEQKFHKKYPKEKKISTLFQGNKKWVHSIATIGTPHNGSTYADNIDLFIPFVKDLILGIGVLSGQGPTSMVYDFKLDQWGLKKKPDETYAEYAERVYNSPIWKSRDISVHDLSTYGANDLNAKMKTYTDMYYISYTGEATYKSPVSGHYLPRANMLPLFFEPSRFIGSYTRNQFEPYIDKSWWPNDGLVSVNSSLYPAKHPAKSFKGAILRGKWNYKAPKAHWDHMDLVGIGRTTNSLNMNQVEEFYISIAKELSSLPK